MRGATVTVLTTMIVAVAFACMPIGIILAIYMDQPSWLFLTLLAFIFFYAG